jgi:ribulose-phosphate 3-epimerase
MAVRRPISIIPAVLGETWEEFAARMRQAEVFADYVQIDMMDGVFVPTLSFPPEMLDRLQTRLSFEAHMMVDDPLDWLGRMRNPGLKKVIFHIESAADPLDAIAHITEAGMEAAVAFRPETSLAEYAEIASQAGSLLFLAVDPGRYGSPFHPEVLEKVHEARRIFPDKGISVDGGVSPENLGEIWRAGADAAAVGSRIFLKGDPAANYRLFTETARKTAAGG